MLAPIGITSYASSIFFLYNAPPPSEIHTLSLHDALPIFAPINDVNVVMDDSCRGVCEESSYARTNGLRFPIHSMCSRVIWLPPTPLPCRLREPFLKRTGPYFRTTRLLIFICFTSASAFFKAAPLSGAYSRGSAYCCPS